MSFLRRVHRRAGATAVLHWYLGLFTQAPFLNLEIPLQKRPFSDLGFVLYLQSKGSLRTGIMVIPHNEKTELINKVTPLIEFRRVELSL